MNDAEMEAYVKDEREQLRMRGLPRGGKPLKNRRHELFAQYYVQGKTCKEAYLKAGYSQNPASVKGNAHKLLWKADIMRRIDRLALYQEAVYRREIRLKEQIKC